MKKYLLLLPLLLFGCGDDLGWDKKQKDHDCSDSAVADAGSSDVVQPQDVSEVNDVGTDTIQIIEDANNATETDVADSVGDNDVGDAVSDSGPSEDTEQAEIAEDATQVEDTVDVSEDATETADVPVVVPECATNTDCADGDGCTINEACDNGKCVVGVPFNCDDGNICTDDSCESVGKDEMHVCKHLPNQATCTDDNVCSLDDACDGMSCKSKTAAICDDSNMCTSDSCDPVTGCVFLPSEITCTDNNVCTLDDKCEVGVCTAGPLKVCDDANICTVDSCDPVDSCKVINVADGTKCAEGICQNGVCACVSGFGCASPSFSYASETNAGMLGGMGGQVGPKMGCDATDVLIGIGFDFSNGTNTATRTTVVCGKVSVKNDGTVETQQTTTQKNGGSGCFGWDPSTPTPLAVCKSGWAVVGIQGKKPGDTLFNSVKLICGKLDVSGKPTGETETLVLEGMDGAGTDQEVLCPEKTIARFFETRAGCGQDALTMYCATATPDCTNQQLICKDL